MGRMAADLQNPNVVNPTQARWEDMDNNERAARLIGGAAQGFKKLGNQPQQMGSPVPIQPTQTAPVSNDYFAPQNPMRNPMAPNRSAFYGGGGF